MTEKPTYEELEQRIAMLENESIKQKRMGNLIWEGEKIMRVFLDIPNAIALLIDPNAILLYANETLAKWFNTDISKLIGKCIWDIFPPDVSKNRRLEFEKVLQSKKQVRFEGERQGIWTESILTPILDDYGEVEKVAVFGFDITEHKQVEDYLRRSEAKFRAMTTNISDVIGILDAEGGLKYMSPNIEKLFGWLPEDKLGTDGWSTIHPDDLERVKQAWISCIEKENSTETIEYRYLCKNGSYKFIETTVTNLLNDPIIDGVLINFHDITKRKEAEEKLEKEHVFLQGVINSIPGIFYLFPLTENSKMVLWNDALQTLTGYTDKEIGRMNPMQFMEPRFFDIIGEKMKEVLEKGSANVEATFVRKDGSYVPMLLTGRLLTIDGVHYDVGVGVDITEQKQMEVVLRESECTFRKLFEESSDPILLIDETGVFVECNQAALDLLKMTREQFLFLPPVNISPEFQPNGHKSKEYALEMIELAYKKGLHRFDWTCVNAEGGEFIVDVSLMPIVLKGKTMLHTTWRNITERKKIEEEHRFLSTITANLSDSIIVTNARFEIIYINRETEKLFGYSWNELKGKTPDLLNAEPTADEIRKKIYETVSSGNIFLGESFNKKKDGSIFNCEYKIMFLPGKDGKTSAYVSLQRDITERKQAEAEKLIAQKNADNNDKMALVGQIAGKIAHDFNNILGIVMGNTELALLDCLQPNTKKTLELIYKQTIRGKNLTKNLVAFAKDQEPKQEFLRISEKIELVLNLMKKDLEGIELRKEESQGVPELLADPGMIEHALVNLIQNSIHALSMVEYPRITIRTYNRVNHVCFEIEDNGCGISQDNLRYIYEPSFTLKGTRDVAGSYKTGIKGTGYGMSNVKKYIEQHKGSISVESELGSGTKFLISLPIIKKELTIEEKTEIRKGKSHFEKYILLVEDETAIADVQYRILTQEPCNHKVDIANNGKVAMDLLGRNKYDLISLDYILPGDINGMDIYHHIRLSDKTIPILFISGNIEFLESIKELKQKDNAIEHLSKPCQNKDYVNAINGLFEITLAAKQ